MKTHPLRILFVEVPEIRLPPTKTLPRTVLYIQFRLEIAIQHFFWYIRAKRQVNMFPSPPKHCEINAITWIMDKTTICMCIVEDKRTKWPNRRVAKNHPTYSHFNCVPPTRRRPPTDHGLILYFGGSGVPPTQTLHYLLSNLPYGTFQQLILKLLSIPMSNSLFRRVGCIIHVLCNSTTIMLKSNPFHPHHYHHKRHIATLSRG